MPHRPLYIDECLSRRLARWLRHRGRNAHAWNELENGALQDPTVIPKVIKELGQDVVFITADNSLPEEHRSLVAKTGATLAIVAPYDYRRSPWQSYSGISEEESWKRDIVQRWAHRMQRQDQGSVLRYRLHTYGVWTPPRAKPARRRPPDEDARPLAA